MKILLAQMMKFLTFPCLAIHQSMYSFPSGNDVQHCVSVSVHHPPLGSSCIVLSLGWGCQAPQRDPAVGWCGYSSMRSWWAQTGRKLSQAASTHRHTNLTCYYPCIGKRSPACAGLDSPRCVCGSVLCNKATEAQTHLCLVFSSLCKAYHKANTGKIHFAPYRKNTTVNYQLSSMHFVGLF